MSKTTHHQTEDDDFCNSEVTDMDKHPLSHLDLWSSSPVLPVLLLFLMCPQLCACCVCLCCCMCEQAMYKSKAKDLLKSGCNELLRPDILIALYTSTMGSKVNSHRVVNHCNSDPCPQTSRK